jgi:predicted AAA+ superfamily ATPase
LSLDVVTRELSSNLSDVLAAYEEIIGKSFENLDKTVILFLDEVQYDDNWAITLKTIYDRSQKVFIFATGSSALALNYNTDVARRAVFEKLFPMCFSEYLKIKQGKYEIRGLASSIRKAIFNSFSAKEVFGSIKKLEPSINRYWYGVDRLEVSRYLEYGSLPYMIKLENEAMVYDQIAQTIDKIITKDIPQVGQVTNDILSKVPSILYAVSDADTLNVKKLAEMLDISRPTLSNLLEALEKAELLYRVYPHGSHYSQVKKPSKYLFSSSAFRSMYFHSLGNITKELTYKGHLMEDVFVGYCKRQFWGHPEMSLTYDPEQGGADFIIGIGNDNLICEVGYGKKDYRQVIATMKKVKARYGMCISSNELELREDINAISIPLKYLSVDLIIELAPNSI